LEAKGAEFSDSCFLGIKEDDQGGEVLTRLRWQPVFQVDRRLGARGEHYWEAGATTGQEFIALQQGYEGQLGIW